MEKISVCLRIRPMNEKEQKDKEVKAWKVVDNKQIELNQSVIKDVGMTKQCSYEFQHCFQEQHDNLSVFETCIKDIILSCLEGINSTLFMYGQTGAGKTFTMLGRKKQELQKKNTQALQEFIKQSFQKKEFNDVGILIYSLMEIFKEINKDQSRQYELKCSYFEIYNENVYDLLRPQRDFQNSLQIGVDMNKEFIIKGLQEMNVTSLEEVITIIHDGERNRHYAETILNHQSSRSHTVFKLKVSAYLPDEESDILKCSTEAVVNFIDLAGSEKISNHQQVLEEKDRIKESQSINKSLFFLTRVIALKTQKTPPAHIPYRNSTLTKIMKSSLVGNFRTIICLCITPALSQVEYTQSTIRFGESARLIENKISQNFTYDDDLPQLYQKLKEKDEIIFQQQEMIEKLRNEQMPLNDDEIIYDKNKSLYKQLTAQQEKNKLLEKQSQDLYKRLLKSNEQILEYYASHKELEQLISELRQQNQKLQSFAQQALNRLEQYEQLKNNSSEENLKQIGGPLSQFVGESTVVEKKSVTSGKKKNKKGEKGISTSPFQKSKRPKSSEGKKQEESLHGDITSLASRLYNLTEEFSQRKVSPLQAYNWDKKWGGKLENVIMETESEIGLDSKSSLGK